MLKVLSFAHKNLNVLSSDINFSLGMAVLSSLRGQEQKEEDKEARIYQCHVILYHVISSTSNNVMLCHTLSYRINLEYAYNKTTSIGDFTPQ